MIFHTGALSGTFDEAADVIASETTLRTIPRGEDFVAFTCSMLRELPVERGPRGWRLSHSPNHRLWDSFDRKLDRLEELWGTTNLFVSALGPWSLAAQVELPNGHLAVTDKGALRDITEVLAESLASQYEEPLLSELEAGQIPGTSDFDVIAPVPATVLGERLAGIKQLATNHLHVARIAQPHTLVFPLAELTGTEKLDLFGELYSSGMDAVLAVEPTCTVSTISRLFDCLSIEPRALDLTNASTRSNLLDTARMLAAIRQVDETLARDF
ncbi:hypothetical protein P4N68_12245 [Corynebacterium felinum]|uniref:Methionine synthase n=1 Tax=Corynebacterium felinum TaxID=131318 RepID=A0ABU2B9S2_9CORY|nr:hypothetical protein [Corynebacterium felinum]MDF5821837.1 hypothetical protein [Corynebacterium felinum]MDR7355353.1 hypothetical protein [Corynebacterium felinum]WJY94705.1 hypothetical protein CFELI_05385 [Corynebacterium felinum]